MSEKLSHKDEQRADWAYGNAHLSNPDVTLEMCREAVRKKNAEASMSEYRLPNYVEEAITLFRAEVIDNDVESDNAYEGEKLFLNALRFSIQRYADEVAETQQRVTEDHFAEINRQQHEKLNALIASLSTGSDRSKEIAEELKAIVGDAR